MSLQKKYLKTKPICKVKFELPQETIGDAETAFVVGEFNNWDPSANAMKKQKNGSFAATLDLTTGREYQFRYFIGDDRWENEPHADRYIPNNLCGEDNSVVAV